MEGMATIPVLAPLFLPEKLLFFMLWCGGLGEGRGIKGRIVSGEDGNGNGNRNENENENEENENENENEIEMKMNEHAKA